MCFGPSQAEKDAAAKQRADADAAATAEAARRAEQKRDNIQQAIDRRTAGQIRGSSGASGRRSLYRSGGGGGFLGRFG